jgi:hypothetical protein
MNRLLALVALVLAIVSLFAAGPFLTAAVICLALSHLV